MNVLSEDEPSRKRVYTDTWSANLCKRMPESCESVSLRVITFAANIPRNCGKKAERRTMAHRVSIEGIINREIAVLFQGRLMQMKERSRAAEYEKREDRPLLIQLAARTINLTRAESEEGGFIGRRHSQRLFRGSQLEEAPAVVKQRDSRLMVLAAVPQYRCGI